MLKKRFSVRVRKRDGTTKLLHSVYGLLMVGAAIKNPDGKGQFVGIEITATPPGPGVPAEAREIAFRDRDEPAFDPKKNFDDLLTLTFGSRDIEEFRPLPISPELEALLIEAGFSDSVAGFITRAFIEACISTLPKRRRGRPPRPSWERLDEHAKELARIKQVLRASGEKGSVHKKAMQNLEANYEEIRKNMDPDERPHLPPFPRDALENYVKRSKKRRTK